MADHLQDKLQKTLGDAFTLERELGGGGMSRVFVAVESALGRKIVVKMLPSDTAAGVSVERFKREIQVVARLQHPHIVPILTAGESDGLPFYTMPFVKGESLRERLSRGGEMSVNEAIHVLRDVAAALAYAHGEGVVHRDIKPDNVIVSGGVAVVTDFGVSKAVDVSVTDGGKAKTGITSMGIALGTPAYMSPEQASADPQVDHRADVYSFGCLAYELMAGTSPFGGRPPHQMLAAHVTETPEHLSKRRPSVPPLFAALVMRCLEKRAGDRPQTADELLTALDSIATPSGGTMPTFERLSAVGGKQAKWIAGVAVAAAVVALGFQAWSRFMAAPTFTIGATTPIAVSSDIELKPAISPDGKLVAYGAPTPEGIRVFVRQIDGGRARLLSGEPEGDHFSPQWSPDGSRISFESGNAIYVLPALTGGSPRRIVEGSDLLGHAWSADGRSIVFSAVDGIRLRVLDGDSSRLIVPRVDFVHSPTLSPDGKTIAYVRGQPPTLFNISTSAVWIVPVSGGTPIRVSDSTHVNLSPVWTPDGKGLLYLSSMQGARDVYYQGVSASGSLRGVATRLTTGLSAFTISISADGAHLAYDLVRNFSNIWVATIGRTPTTTSNARQVTRDNQHIEALRLSADGKWLVYDSDRAGNFDIYKLRIDGGDPVQLTTQTANDFSPSWSPDGSQIAFHSPRFGSRDIFVVSAEGGAEQQVTSGPSEDFSPVWSPDGETLTYYSAPATSGTVWSVSRRAGGWSAPHRVSMGAATIQFPNVSPDGRRLVWVQGDPLLAVTADVVIANADGSGARVVADVRALGGVSPFASWSNDGSTIYAYVRRRAGAGAIVAIPAAGGPPRDVLVQSPDALFGRFQFATDDTRMFFTRATFEADVWVMELKR